VYLKTRLRILILVTLLPVVGVGVIGTWLLVNREIDAVQAGTWGRTRALTTAIDAEFRTSIAALQLLAGSPQLRAGDLQAFRAEAERALHSRGGRWLNLFVSDARTAELLLDLRATPGAPQPPPTSADPDSVLRAAQSRQATVSQLIVGDAVDRRVFAVRVPVMFDDGPADYVLSAAIDPALIVRLVEAQHFPPEWAVAVVDGNLRLIARKPEVAGDPPIGESLRRALKAPSPGWAEGTLMDGQKIYRTIQRSTTSDWAVSVGIPKATVEESLRYVQLLWIGFGLTLAVSLLWAWWLAKGVTRPIAALAEAAPALGQGRALALPDAGAIEEVRRLYLAMQQAAAMLQQRDADRAVAESALRAANRAKDEFLAMLGHELRNPLSAVSNAAELLQHASARPELIPKVAGVLGRQVHQMSRLVDDLLEVGRVTAGKIALVPTELDLAEAVRQTLAAFEGNGRLAHHPMDVRLQPVWVEADGTRLEQIVSNLLDNAVKYTPPGGRIDVSVRRDGSDAALVVADTGQGMTPELVRSAFDLFVQGDRTLSRESGGLGIGLTLAQRLAQLHRGRITAESAGPGQGSTFTLYLPAIDAPAAVLAAPAAGVAHPARRVLVIEDNADAGESLVALLELLGHKVEWTGLGLLGVEKAAALQPDLVLVDIGLPDIDGYEVARRLREREETRALQLVALTGYGTPEDRGRALAAGFDRHRAKPIGRPELEALLR
jgi:signal transduction histidine kinase